MYKSLFRGRTQNATHQSSIKKTSCGQQIQWFLICEAGVILNISFDAQVSQLSLKALDIMAKKIHGQDINNAKKIDWSDILYALELPITGQREQEIYELYCNLKEFLNYVT